MSAEAREISCEELHRLLQANATTQTKTNLLILDTCYRVDDIQEKFLARHISGSLIID